MKQGEKEIMPETIADDKALKLAQGTGERKPIAVNVREARFSMYKFILFLLDLLTVNLGFFHCSKVFVGGYNMGAFK